MPNVDPVILKLQADLKDYQRDLGAAQKLTDTKLDAIERRGMQMGQGLRKGFDLAKGAAIAFAAAVSVDALARAITSGLDYASSLGEVAQQLGVTTDALQEYRYAATQVGLSQEEMDMALAQLTRRAGEAASGTKAQAEAFDKLGVSVRTANNEIVPTGDLIPQIADALQKIESPAQRAAILMDLFGKSGQKLEPLLSEGARGIEEFKRRAHELGMVLDQNLIRQADQAADRVAELQQQLQINISGTVARNANAILGLANALAALTSNSLQFIANYPRLTGALTGAAIGARLGGAPGAAIGGSLGVIGGATAARDRANSIDDLDYRRQRQAAALAEVNRHLSGKAQGGMFTVYRGSQTGSLESATKNLKRENELLRQATQNRLALKAMQAVGALPQATGTVASGAGNGAGAGGGSTGPSAKEIQHQLDNELASYALQAISAMQSVATSTEERADLELRSVELARIRTLADIDANKEYSAAQKERLRGQAEETAQRERERVEFQRKAQAERDAADIADAKYRVEADALRGQIDLADSNEKRLDLATQMIDLEYRYQRALLESVIASETTSKVDKERARIALAGLDASMGDKRKAAAREYASPGERYLDSLKKDAAELNEAYQNVAVDGLRSLNDGLVEAIMGSKSLGDVFKNVANQIIADLLRIAIQQSIIQPLASGLFSAGGIFGTLAGSGGSGGGIGGGIGGWSSFGRASGGYVAPGQFYRVNEAASPGRVEGFMSRDGGRIVPLGQMNALQQGGAGQGGGTATVRLELSGDIDARIQRVSGPVAIEVVRASAPTIIDASARETMARAGRPRL